MRVLVYGMVGTNRGGIETFLKKMSSFISYDMIFDYVIEEDKCIHEDEIKARGGKIYFITGRRKNPVKNVIDNRRLLKSGKKEFETVYFNLSSLSWIVPVMLAAHYGYRVCVHSHNAQFIAANSSLVYRIVNRINKGIISRMKITRLTCSKPATEFMFKSSDNVEMIYNAIDTSQYIFSEEIRLKIRKKYNLEQRFVIGFAGRISDQKNPLFLPQIMSETVKLIPGCVMLIAGDGDMKNELLQKIKKYKIEDRMIILGNITNVNEIMQAMDVFVLPSKHEGLPYVVVEAQTAGLPCVISDVITHEVDATGEVSFLSIEQGADLWAKELENVRNNSHIDRCNMGNMMEKSVFNIGREAKHLEKILRGD